MILEKIIESRMKSVDKTDYYIVPETISVTSAKQTVNLGSNVYFLDTETLDIPIQASLELISPDNYISTSKAQYEKLGSGRYIWFTDTLKIISKNYGATFTPFKLNFIKAVPQYERK